MADLTGIQERITEKLSALYGPEIGLEASRQVLNAVAEAPVKPRTYELTERDAVLIAYGDHIQREGSSPLSALQQFLASHLRDAISAVHILPFYPYSSDDGFSVIDYHAVDPALGSWADISSLSGNFRLMFDLVLNHVSASSPWFLAFLRDEPPYRDYFITESPATDLSMVTRPRTHPLLTAFQTKGGTRHVWTTFSDDQIDLNYANPAVLIEMIKTLLFYVQEDADLIRLDAIAYLWKTVGTPCIHLPQTHLVVQLFRDVLNIAAPWVKLITETNVPHQENLSYFGDGSNEAQLVYQFALPPLVLDAFYREDALSLSRWASTLQTPSLSTTFFNFTASHDGIGVRPATGLISDDAIRSMLETVQARGGQISYKSNSDGTQQPYEMNITYFDALAIPGEPLSKSEDRFLASQAIMLALAGVPGIYLPSSFGAPNWQEGVRQSGRARTINRQKFQLRRLEKDLAVRGGRGAQVFERYVELLRLRRAHGAFHPNAPQRILDLRPQVFAVERHPLHDGEPILALHNVAGQGVTLQLPYRRWHDVITKQDGAGELTLNPYQTAWLKAR